MALTTIRQLSRNVEDSSTLVVNGGSISLSSTSKKRDQKPVTGPNFLTDEKRKLSVW